MKLKKPLYKGLRTSKEVIEKLETFKHVERVSVAGAVRRMKETFKKVIIVCSSEEPGLVMEEFQRTELVNNVLYKTEQRLSFLTQESIRVDLIIVEPTRYVNTLLYFTGSPSHTRMLRNHARKQCVSIKKQGVFRNGEKLNIKTEHELYKELNMQFIPPELRQGGNELSKALNNEIPDLIKEEDVKGDFHIHSTWSDGVSSIEEIAEYCRKELEYSYMGVSDHAGHIGLANSMNEEALKKRSEEIKDLNSTYSKFRILNCAEVDIKTRGGLSMSDEVLKELDVVIASLHYDFDMNRAEMTNRICKALRNEYVNILGHPTGRRVLHRPGVDFNTRKVFQTGLDNNIFFEINCKPFRMDLSTELVQQGKELGVKFAINTDAHTINQLNNIPIGIGIGKRGTLVKNDVLNTRSISFLQHQGLIQ